MAHRFRRRSTLIALSVAMVVGLPACSLFRSKAENPPPPAPAPPPMAAPHPAPPPPAPFKGAKLADEGALQELQPGKTTRAEVRDRFGVPREVIASPAGETFLYYRDVTSGWFTRTTDRVEMLTIRFDAQGILKDFEYRYAGQ